MHRVDTSTASAALPVVDAAGTPGFFTKGNPANSTPATVPGQDWFNMVQEELNHVVESSGLTPDQTKTDYTQLLQALSIMYKPINSIDVPTGTILQGYFTTPPAGFLICDGTTLSRSTYANLWAYAQATGVTISEALWPVNVGLFSVGDGSTSFRVPDLRDMFLRSKSAARALGSFQTDDFKSHTHRQQNTTAVGGSIEQGRGLADGNLVYINGYQVEATGGAETRPVNIALTSIIKY